MRWYEFDMGWMYITIISALGLARIKKVVLRPKFNMQKAVCDAETLQAAIAHRYEIVTKYVRTLKATCATEVGRIRASGSVPTLATMREGRAIKKLSPTVAHRSQPAKRRTKNHANRNPKTQRHPRNHLPLPPRISSIVGTVSLKR